MKHTVLSPEKMQEATDALYESFGLPLEGQTCHGQLAAVLPILVAQLPQLSFESRYGRLEEFLPEADGRWSPEEYELHIPFARTVELDNPRLDMSLKAMYRRTSEATHEPEFVHVYCFCSVPQLSPGRIGLRIQFCVKPLKRRPNAFTTEPTAYSYALDLLGFIRADTEFGFEGRPSSAAFNARVQLQEEHNRRLKEEWKARFQALRVLGERKMFSYTEGKELVGEAMLKLFTHDDGQEGDWFSLGHVKEDEHIILYTSMYQPDGHGGLYEVRTYEDHVPYFPLRSDQEWIDWNMLHRR